jgi:hypothetical protein
MNVSAVRNLFEGAINDVRYVFAIFEEQCGSLTGSDWNAFLQEQRLVRTLGALYRVRGTLRRARQGKSACPPRPPRMSLGKRYANFILHFCV